MAKVTITIEDSGDDKAELTTLFEPRITNDPDCTDWSASSVTRK